jgi:hypothetical protein
VILGICIPSPIWYYLLYYKFIFIASKVDAEGANIMGEFLLLFLFIIVAVTVFGSMVLFAVALPFFLIAAVIGLVFSIIGLVFKFIFGGPLLFIVIVACLIYFLRRK